MQPVTPGLLEQFILSKPYFDPEGLVVALADGEVVGFVHAGFGPNEEQTAISTDDGTTHQLMLRPEHRDEALADELLGRAEAYLRDRGAKVIYAGGIRPLNGFYLGLYGGSELPGVLATDLVLQAACSRCGYRPIDRVDVLQLELGQFRPLITRQQRLLSREMISRELYAPPVASWWEACTVGEFERVRFMLAPAASEQPVATVDFWDIEPLSTHWGIPAAGMLDLQVVPQRRRQGLASFMLADAFERLRRRGILLVEVQTMQSNEPAHALYRKLGFSKVDEGVVYRKDNDT
jgi:ribosomal protein S18 acetylase RimI-like enzyme